MFDKRQPFGALPPLTQQNVPGSVLGAKGAYESKYELGLPKRPAQAGTALGVPYTTPFSAARKPAQTAVARPQSNQNPSGIPKPAFPMMKAHGPNTTPWQQPQPAIPAAPVAAPAAQPKQRKPINPALAAALTPPAEEFGPPDDHLWPKVENGGALPWQQVQGENNLRSFPGGMPSSQIRNAEVPSGGGIATMGDQTVMLRGGKSVPQAENDAVIAQREKNYGPQPTLVGGAGGVVNAMPGQSIAGALSPVETDIENAIAHRRGLQERELSGREGLQQSQIGLNASTVNKNNIEAREMPLNNASERDARNIQGQSALGHLGIAQQMVQPNIDAINNQTAMTNETIDQNRIMRPLQAIKTKQDIDFAESPQERREGKASELQQRTDSAEKMRREQSAMAMFNAGKYGSFEEALQAVNDANELPKQGLRWQPKQEAVASTKLGGFLGIGKPALPEVAGGWAKR